MATTFEPLPLGEYRARILQYLQGITLPLRSTAWTIIERSSEGAQATHSASADARAMGVRSVRGLR